MLETERQQHILTSRFNSVQLFDDLVLVDAILDDLKMLVSTSIHVMIIVSPAHPSTPPNPFS